MIFPLLITILLSRNLQGFSQYYSLSKFFDLICKLLKTEQSEKLLLNTYFLQKFFYNLL